MHLNCYHTISVVHEFIFVSLAKLCHRWAHVSPDYDLIGPENGSRTFSRALDVVCFSHCTVFARRWRLPLQFRLKKKKMPYLEKESGLLECVFTNTKPFLSLDRDTCCAAIHTIQETWRPSRKSNPKQKYFKAPCSVSGRQHHCGTFLVS